jgi:membrane dipeptidase
MTDGTRIQARELIAETFVVDGHFDLTYEVTHRRERGERQVVASCFLPDLRRGGVDLVVSAIFIQDYFLPEMGLRRALDQISDLNSECKESPGNFRLCRTVAEAIAAKKAGELALFLSLEGADPLQNDLRLLPIFYQLGVRGLGLVWSRRNYAGDGCFFDARREGRKGGLTPFGLDLVEAAEEIGMFLDVSHLNDEGFWDVMEVATKPLIASHSNCRALCSTMRNLTDAQILAIARKKGVVGCNAVDRFLNHSASPAASVADMVRHIDHIVELAGIGHVGIGLDLCDGFRDHLQLEPALVTKDVIKTHAALDELIEALMIRGYSDQHIRAIAGGNLIRLFTEVLN